ncbi:MAG: hypothetical protein PHD51_03070 [Patescibacteria group bacterium]|nr:hypothetical protein [Patescibacteria group bacterium]MDD5491036.1 hypothetical protein [Patescibacteria group bacterium]
MLLKLKDFLDLSVYTLKEEGFFSFCQKALAHLAGSIFSYNTILVYEKDLTKLDNIYFYPRLDGAVLKIISSIDEYNKAKEGGYSLDIAVSERWIGEGAIAFCVFVGRDLAHLTWVALNQETKSHIDSNNYQVDFLNKEVASGASKTKKKYLRKGLYLFVYSEIFIFLHNLGKTRDKFTINESNTASRRALEKFNPRIIKKIKCLRILFFSKCRELPLIF